MAIDKLLERGGKLAMPPRDIGSDADINDYQQALDDLLQGMRLTPSCSSMPLHSPPVAPPWRAV